MITGLIPNFEQMKRFVFFSLMVVWFLSSCAREKSYVKVLIPPAPSERVTLPQTPEWYEVNGERYYPLPDAEGFVQYAKASWYGPKFHGRPTSSGQIFDMYKKTAAHKILPLFTVVKVINLTNQKSVIVPINDRGPFVKGREIDLSYAAATDIGLIGPGVVDVKIVALGREVGMTGPLGKSRPVVEVRDFRSGEFTVQVGSFQERENAFRLADRMKPHFDYVNVTTYLDEEDRFWYRVHVSKTETLDQANEMLRRFESMGFPAFIIRL
jgi:rare lipoprotein A